MSSSSSFPSRIHSSTVRMNSGSEVSNRFSSLLTRAHYPLLVRFLWHIGLAGLLAQLALAPVAFANCSDLAALRLAKTTITSARTVAAGAFVLPPDSPRADPSYFTAFDTLAAFCRVQGVIK